MSHYKALNDGPNRGRFMLGNWLYSRTFLETFCFRPHRHSILAGSDKGLYDAGRLASGMHSHTRGNK